MPNSSTTIPIASAPIALTGGTAYPIHVEFADATGPAVIKVRWSTPVTPAMAGIPSANVFKDSGLTTPGLTAVYYNSTDLTGQPNVTVTETNNPAITWDFGSGRPDPALPYDNFSVRWTGQVLPQYSETYTFDGRSDDGMKLWVNGQLLINQWKAQGATDVLGTIALQAGVRYDVVCEYLEVTSTAEAHLSWYSNSQPKQIIPTGRLFPTATGATVLAGNPPAAPPGITSPSTAVALLNAGSPFTYTIAATNSATNFSASNLPAWMTLTNGVLSGTPPAAGHYQFTITATNSAGSSSSVVDLNVIDSGQMVTRDLFNAASGFSTFANNPDSATNVAITGLEDTTNYADGSGQRMRGYIIPPATGNYYFWLAANNQAELWISNNNEPVNKIRRAFVTASTGDKIWNTQASQRTPWMSLVAGQKYYYEVLHLPPAGSSNDYVNVGAFQDPTGNSAALANGTGLVPASMLAPFDYPPTTAVSGKIYITNLSAVAGLTVASSASGGAYVRVNGGETQAVVHFSYGGLSSGELEDAKGIYQSPSGALVFSVGAVNKLHPELKTADGGYTWNLSSQNVADLKAGNLYFSVATVSNPSGEISGTFGVRAGSQAPPPAPAVRSATDDHTTTAGASRFLSQATYGPANADISYINANGFRAWVENQFTYRSYANSHLVPDVLANLNSDPSNPYPDLLTFNSWWKNALTAPDQLRHRVAFALSEILVISDQGPLNNNGRILADYYDVLLDNAFGNFRNILKQVTLTPAMGIYLNMQGNDKGDNSIGRHPNENYAREIMQLFSIGLYRTWPDGSLVLDSTGNPVPTYTQNEITGLARVLTGWNYGQVLQGNGRMPVQFFPSADYLDPMVLVPTHHELGSKLLLNNVMLPAAVNQDSSTTLTDPNPITVQTVDPVAGQGNLVSTAISNQYDLNGLKDLEASLDSIFNSPNVGPFICRQLIQRLVTSTPKPDYLYRVVQAFNGERNVDGVATGVRGDMQEVIRAILLDYEARSSDLAAQDTTYGKQREPILRVTGPARAFPPISLTGTYDERESFNGTSGAFSDTLNLITVDTSPTAPRLANNDNIRLNFSSAVSPGHIPTTQGYVAGNISGNTFTVPANGFSSVAWTEAADGTVSVSATGLPVGSSVYLKFYKNGSLAANSTTSTDVPDEGIYTVASVSGGTFTVAGRGSLAVRSSASNKLLIPKLSGGYSVRTNTGVAAPNDKLITITTAGNHDLTAGDQVQLFYPGNTNPVPPANGVYTVQSVLSADQFTVTGTNAASADKPGLTVYPLYNASTPTKPSLTRHGNVGVQQSTYVMNTTTTELNQSPLNSPTVFNFFYPDFQYPGTLANFGLVTPEFQLTTDTNTINMQNFLYGGVISSEAGNPSGPTNFKSGAIALDLSPFMTAGYTTSGTNIGLLVDALNSLLCGGQFSSGAKTQIVNYITDANFPTNSLTNVRDRVRAAVYLVISSPDYAIQR